MKKLMYLLPFAALAMASCSSSEDVAQNVQTPSQELKFFPAIEGTTRGAIETSSSISQFYVNAVGDFKGAATGDVAAITGWQAVTKEGTTWTPANKLWWALDSENGGNEAQGTFTAFANALNNAGDPMTQADANNKLVNVTIPTTLASQKDLVVAYNAGKRTDFISGVPLHFRHALSQIVVNATYNNAAGVSTNDYPELVIKVKGIKFVNLATTGTLTLPSTSTAAGNAYDPVWASVTGSAEFASAAATELTLANAAQYIDDSESGNPLLLMPQTTAATTNLNPTAPATVTGAYLMVQVDIDEKESGDNVYPKEGYTGNEGYAWIAVPVDINWKGGYKYTYTLNFSNIAAGKVAPGTTSAETDQTVGDPVIAGVRTPVNFLVTVEEAWIDGGSFTPAM